MLDELGHAAEAKALEVAVRAAVAEGVLTPDAGGQAKTKQVTDAVLEKLQAV